MTRLHDDINRHRIEAALRHLEAGDDPNQRDARGKLPIEFVYYYPGQVARTYALLPLAQALLDCLPHQHLPSNADDLWSISLATQDFSLAGKLIQRGYLWADDIERVKKSLWLSAYQENPATLEWLIDQGVSITKETACGALFMSVGLMHQPQLTLLLQNGADVNWTKNKYRGSDRQSSLLDTFVEDVLCERLRDNETDTQRLATAQQIFETLVNAGFLLNAPKHCSSLTNLLLTFVMTEHHDTERYCYPFLWPLFRQIQPLLQQLPDDQGLLIRLASKAIREDDGPLLRWFFNRCPQQAKPYLLVCAAKQACQQANTRQLAWLCRQGLNLNQYIYHAPGHYAHAESIGSYGYRLAVRHDTKFTAEQRSQLFLFLLNHQATLYLPTYYPTHLLSAAVAHGLEDVVDILLKGKHFPVDTVINASFRPSATALQRAVGLRDVAMVKLLLHHGANVHIQDANGRGLLHRLLEPPKKPVPFTKNDVMLVQTLIDAGINVNATVDRPFIFQQWSVTPIGELLSHTRISSVHQELLYLLIAHGAQIDKITFVMALERAWPMVCIKVLIEQFTVEQLSQQCLLHHALRLNLTTVPLIDALLAKGGKALLTARDFMGRTPLHLATTKENVTLFDYLRRAGAELTALDHSGYSVAVHALFHDTQKTLRLSLPETFPIEEFYTLREQLRCEQEITRMGENDVAMKNWLVSDYAYKLIQLFSNAETALRYIDKYRNSDSRQPLHDLCLFSLPQTSAWRPELWATFVLEHGPRVIQYIAAAANIERIMGGVPTNPDDIASVIKARFMDYYPQASQNLSLAQLFAQYGISERGFNVALAHYNPERENTALPSLRIEGVDLETPQPDYYFEKLAPNDFRGFILGALTHCCQSVGLAGEPCALHGMSSPNGGFYVLMKYPQKRRVLYELATTASDSDAFLALLSNKSQRRAYRRIIAQMRTDVAHQDDAEQRIMERLRERLGKPQIVAQCWAWISQQGSVVFDSWESIRCGHLCVPFLTRAAQEMIAEHGIETVLLGSGGQTPRASTWVQVKSSQTERPKDYEGYRDSLRQYLIAHKIVALTSATAVDTSSSHSVADCQQALQQVFSSCPQVLLWPAITNPILSVLFDAKAKLAQSDGMNTLIIPRLSEDGWQAYLLHKGISISDRWLSGPVKYESTLFITHLNPNARRVSQNSIAEVPLTQSYFNLGISKQDTGIWLVERLCAFARTGYVTVPPAFHAPPEALSLVEMVNQSTKTPSRRSSLGVLSGQQGMYRTLIDTQASGNEKNDAHDTPAYTQ